jgi:hypothetical protein
VDRVLDSSLEPWRAAKEGVMVACGSGRNTPASAGRSFARAERSMAGDEIGRMESGQDTWAAQDADKIDN